MNVHITTIQHKNQRYPTVGDWQFVDDTLYIRVSNLGDWRMEMAVAIHELHEALLAQARGIAEKAVDDFDIDYEKRRLAGEPDLHDEPGDDPACPVYKEHFFATTLERLFATEIGLNWDEYNSRIEDL